MKATEVTAGLAESNGSLLAGLWRDSLHVTCGLTACTPGSAPGPALGNEYGKTLPLPYPPRGVRGGALAAKRFSCILEAPNGLSWNLLAAKFWGAMAPLPPPSLKSAYEQIRPLLLSRSVSSRVMCSFAAVETRQAL